MCAEVQEEGAGAREEGEGTDRSWPSPGSFLTQESENSLRRPTTLIPTVREADGTSNIKRVEQPA